MNRWFKKNYRLFSGMFLAVVFVGWTAFVNNSDTHPSEASSPTQALTPTQTVQVSIVDRIEKNDTQTVVAEPDAEPVNDTVNDITPEPVAEPTAEPVAEPTAEPVVEPTVEPTQEPTLEPTAEPTAEPTQEPVVELAITFPYAIANISSKMNVRSGPGEEHSVIAKMSANSYCEVLEWGPEWTKIKSGTVTGYAYTEYLAFNRDCIEKLQRLNKLLVKVTSNTLNIRSQPNTDCKVLAKAYNGHKYMYLPDKSVEGWYCIQYSETEVGYLSSEYCTIFIDAETAVPVS